MNKTLATLITLLVGTTLFAAQLPDSVRTAGAQEHRIKKGWNFDITFGVGFGQFQFGQIGSSYTPPHTTSTLAAPTWNAGLGINYYFLPWMGLGTGVQFSTYASRSAIGKAWVVTGHDYQGDVYTLTATPQNLSERQGIYMIELPLALRFRAIKSKVGFHGVAGLKLGFPVYDYYSLNQGGSFHNEVQYAHWDLTIIDNIPGVIEDFNVPAVSNTFATKLRTVNYAAYSELGMLFRLQKRLDLMLAVTATYYFNDILTGKNKIQALGFDQYYREGKYPSPFEADYDGVLRSGDVQQLHPWSVALKIGLSINAGKTQARRDYEKQQRERRRIEREARKEAEEQARREREAEREKQRLQEITIIEIDKPDTVRLVDTVRIEQEVIKPDTVCEEIRRQIFDLIDQCGMNICDFCPVIHDTIYIYVQDTIRDTTSVVEIIPTAPQQLEEVMQAAVIWFKIDDTIPILEPEDILIRIADILTRHPEQQVQVNGHACTLGKPAYNKRLALRRAQAVANRLMELGVKPEQLIVQGLGSDVPYRYNGKHQLDKDRRVEILPVSSTDSPLTVVSEQQAEGNKLPVIEVVLQGSRLAQVARRYYGNPDYWVFIYEANREVVKDPNNLPANAELLIPDLTERLQGKSPEQITGLIEEIRQTVE